MKEIIVLVCLSLANAVIVNHECDDFHEIVVKENLNSPYQMAIDYNNDILYFSESVDDEENESSKLSFLNLKTKKYKKIKGIAGGFASAVDNTNHIVYLGGKDGIFKYDFKTKTASYDGARNISIWQLFYKDVLYFTTFPEEIAYTYKDRNFEKVSELKYTRALLIGISKNNNIYFSNSSGLFCYDVVSRHILEIGDYNLNSFTSDKDDYLFFSTPSEIYYIDDINKSVKKIVSLNNIYGFIVDSNKDIIYAQEEKIVRLKFANTECVTNP